MIFIRRPVLNHASDKSPASVAVPPAETFTRILQRCYDIVSNASNITGVLSTEAELGKQVVKDVKSEVQRFRTGAAESGGMLVTANAKWQMTRLSEDPATALSVEIKDSLARDVCMTFGVPTQLVGLPGTDTYNNLALARVGLLTDTVLPGYVNLYVSSLNDAFMDDPGTGERTAMIKPNTAAIPSMAASRLQLVDTAVKATMLTLNEQRALLGFPPYDDEEADVPVLLEELRIKRLQVESGAGSVADQMANEPG
jgi:phage portal protein BeeE